MVAPVRPGCFQRIRSGIQRCTDAARRQITRLCCCSSAPAAPAPVPMVAAVAAVAGPAIAAAAAAPAAPALRLVIPGAALADLADKGKANDRVLGAAAPFPLGEPHSLYIPNREDLLERSVPCLVIRPGPEIKKDQRLSRVEISLGDLLAISHSGAAFAAAAVSGLIERRIIIEGERA